MLTQSNLKALIHYNPETGLITWLRRPNRPQWSGRWEGREAGALNDKGYLKVTIDGVHWPATHLIWLYMTGEWPKHQIDHIDNRKLNNRWNNLRLATNSQNNMNKGLRSDNSSGHKGVHWDSWKGKWKAEIYVSGKKISLGVYVDKEEAAKAYTEASLKYHGEFRRPSPNC